MALDMGLITGMLLTDLTKAFDCRLHDLLIAKLNAYRFSNIESFSSWHPRGSVLGPLLFKIYINDLFCSDEFQLMNFAHDCSPYDFNYSTDDVIQNHETQTKSLFEWYNFNYFIPNPDKWDLILSDSELTLFCKSR